VSRENVEIVRRINVLFNEGDIESAFELVHPDVQFRDLQSAPDLHEAVRGRDAVRLVLAEWASAYDDFTANVIDYVDADPWVIADVRWHGVGRASGVRVDLRSADACKIEQGKLVDWVVGYADVPAALKAVGPEQ
jgi:ketosteroid isomerase-like protein